MEVWGEKESQGIVPQEACGPPLGSSRVSVLTERSHCGLTSLATLTLWGLITPLPVDTPAWECL